MREDPGCSTTPGGTTKGLSPGGLDLGWPRHPVTLEQLKWKRKLEVSLWLMLGKEKAQVGGKGKPPQR